MRVDTKGSLAEPLSFAEQFSTGLGGDATLPADPAAARLRALSAAGRTAALSILALRRRAQARPKQSPR